MWYLPILAVALGQVPGAQAADLVNRLHLGSLRRTGRGVLRAGGDGNRRFARALRCEQL